MSRAFGIAVILAFLGAARGAQAHNLIRADSAPNDWSDPLPIERPDVSQVYYARLEAVRRQVWFRFSGKAGDRIWFQVGVPVLDRLTERLSAQGTSADEVVAREQHAQGAANVTVSIPAAPSADLRGLSPSFMAAVSRDTVPEHSGPKVRWVSVLRAERKPSSTRPVVMLAESALRRVAPRSHVFGRFAKPRIRPRRISRARRSTSRSGRSSLGPRPRPSPSGWPGSASPRSSSILWPRTRSPSSASASAPIRPRPRRRMPRRLSRPR